MESGTKKRPFLKDWLTVESKFNWQNWILKQQVVTHATVGPPLTEIIVSIACVSLALTPLSLTSCSLSNTHLALSLTHKHLLLSHTHLALSLTHKHLLLFHTHSHNLKFFKIWLFSTHELFSYFCTNLLELNWYPVYLATMTFKVQDLGPITFVGLYYAGNNHLRLQMFRIKTSVDQYWSKVCGEI